MLALVAPRRFEAPAAVSAALAAVPRVGQSKLRAVTKPILCGGTTCGVTDVLAFFN